MTEQTLTFVPGKLPKSLADVVDTYHQTSKYARENFMKFDKTLVTSEMTRKAEKLGYIVGMGEGKQAGQFEFTREDRVYRVKYVKGEMQVRVAKIAKVKA